MTRCQFLFRGKKTEICVRLPQPFPDTPQRCLTTEVAELTLSCMCTTPAMLHLPGTSFLANPLTFEGGTYKFGCPACLEKSRGISGVELCSVSSCPQPRGEGCGRLIVWCSDSPLGTDSAFPKAKRELSCEPLFNQTPSHTLLKTELRIITRKRDHGERKYPAGEDRGPGVTDARGLSGPPLPWVQPWWENQSL